MGQARVWVHRRHEDYPGAGVGLLTMDEELANVLIAAGCAQPWYTDQRRLIPYDPNQPPVPSTIKPKRGRPRKRPQFEESTPPSEDAEIEPSRADMKESPKYPRYKRRDMRAEK